MKKNYNSTLALILLLAFEFATAQQLPIYTNYVLNNFAYNPAVAGYKPHTVLNLNYRNQWVGFKDAPKSFLVSVHKPIGKDKKAGIGGTISSDNAGMLGRTAGYLTYAYHLKLNKDYKLGLGLSIGMIQYRIKLYDAILADKDDQLLTGNLLTNNVFDSNGGLYLYSDKLFFGLSAYQYIGNKITWKDSKSNLSQHFYATVGYNIKATKTVTIQPSALVKYNNPVPIQPEFNLRALYKNICWLGGGYRLYDAACFMAGVVVKEKLSVAYSYDIPTTKLRTYSRGTHEIVLTYQFLKAKKKLDADEEELNNIDNSIKSKLNKQNEEGTK